VLKSSLLNQRATRSSVPAATEGPHELNASKTILAPVRGAWLGQLSAKLVSHLGDISLEKACDLLNRSLCVTANRRAREVPHLTMIVCICVGLIDCLLFHWSTPSAHPSALHQHRQKTALTRLFPDQVFGAH